MADKKLEDLGPASTLADTDLLYVVQGATGRKATVEQAAAYARANLYPAAGAMARIAVERAFRRRFMGPDDTEQFRIEGTPLAVEFWRATGAIEGAGPVMAAWSDTVANVNAVIVGKGTGSVVLGNGAGPMLEAEEGGAGKQIDAPLRVRGGATDWSTQPGLYADASRKLWMGVAGKRVLEVRVDDPGAGDTVALGFAVSSTLAKIVAEGSNTNVALYVQTKGTGNLTVGNSATGNIAYFQPASGGTAVSVLQFQSGPSGQPADIMVNGNAGPLRLGTGGRVNIAGAVALGGKVVRNAGSGYANLNLTATTGHVFIDGASTIASAEFTMPASADIMDGQRISFSASQEVTALTLNANTSQTMVGAPTTMDEETPFTLVFDTTTGKWTRA